MTYGRFQSWTVSVEQSGQRVQNFLVEQLSGRFSGKEIKKAIERNALVVNSVQERHASRRLVLGDRVVFDFSILAVDEPIRAESFEIERVLYEDESLLVYNKPAGIISVIGGLLTILRKKDASLLNVHRLDKETTGALIFSKNDQVKELLIDCFRDKSVEKKYLAIVDGVVKQASGVIDRPIGKLYEKDGNTLWGIQPHSKGGLDAITEWKVLGRGKQASLIECTLITGRTHQIRIHLSNMGFPIIGDIRYGKVFKGLFQPSHHLLHSWKLKFPHPVTGKSIEVDAPIPEVFKDAMDQLIEEGGVY